MSTNPNNEMKNDITWIPKELLKIIEKGTGTSIGPLIGEFGPPNTLKGILNQQKDILNLKEYEDVVKQKRAWSWFIRIF